MGGSIQNLKKGNTEIAAEFIQKAQAELRANARPELKAYLDSIDPYDNIFVCGPCWWGTYPCAVFSSWNGWTSPASGFSP